MLLRFRVANHASVFTEQELSLIADDAADDGIATAEVPGADLRTVPVAAIFGANASGKSNIVMALAFMRAAVLDSHRRWLPDGGVPRLPFLLDAAGRREPSIFVVDFVVGDVRYEYGFGLNDQRVTHEWLYSYPQRRRRLLFERDVAGNFSYGASFTGRRKLVEDAVRPNSLYLSAGAGNNHELLSELHRWFLHDHRIAVDSNFPERFAETVDLWGSAGRERVEKLLRFADLGIEGFAFSPLSASDEEIRRAIQRLRSDHPDEAIDESSVMEAIRRQGEIRFSHRSGDGHVSLELAAESTGTKTWVGLIGPVISTLDRGSVLVVDELDARLHPLLAAELVAWFQAPDTNPHGAQLVFNAHDVALLAPTSSARLRRDEVWLTEKPYSGEQGQVAGATRLVALLDYRPRDGVENLEKRYLAGRYGGLAFLDQQLVDESLGSLGRDNSS